MNILIYGACTKLPRYSSYDNLISITKFLHYGIMSKIQKKSIYNYQEFIRHASYNTGDFFISHTIEKFLKHVFGEGVKFHYQDWDIDTNFKNFDLVVISGGGYFYFDNKSKLPARIKSDLTNLLRDKVKYVLFGVGINSNYAYDDLQISEDDSIIIKNLVESSMATSVRDHNTFDIISSFTNFQVKLIGDPALHISSFYKNIEIIKKNRKLNVGFNIPLHGKTVEKLFNNNLENYIQLIKKFSKLYNLKFISHSQSSRYINLFLLPFIGYKPMYSNSIEELLTEYANTDFVISGKLHCCIISFSYSVPALALAYDIKHREFYKLFNLEKFVEDSTQIEIDSIFHKINDILSDSNNIKNKISEVRNFYFNKTIEFVSDFHLKILNSNQENILK